MQAIKVFILFFLSHSSAGLADHTEFSGGSVTLLNNLALLQLC